MGRYEDLYEKQYGKDYYEGKYGYSDKGTALRPDGSPVNFGGNKEAYDRYKETEADRMAYNESTFNDRYAYQTGNSGYKPPSYNEYMGGGSSSGSSSGGYGGGGSYNSNPYADYLESQKKQLAGAYKENKNNVNQYATSARQQAYIDAQLAKRDLPQQMAYTGATGGISESTKLGLETNYQNNLNNIDTETTREIARLESDYNNGVASAQGEYAQLLAQQQERQRQERLEQERWQQEFNYQKEQNDRDYQTQVAKANSGKSGGNSGGNVEPIKELDNKNNTIANYTNVEALQNLVNYYSQLGYSEAQIQRLINDNQNQIYNNRYF